MISTAVEVEGTLQADGTVVLDSQPELPPGRVRVTLQPVVDYTQSPVWKTLTKIWEGQMTRGHVPRSKEEIDADLAELRDEFEERMLAIEKIREECQQEGTTPPKEEPA